MQQSMLVGAPELLLMGHFAQSSALPPIQAHRTPRRADASGLLKKPRSIHVGIIRERENKAIA
jgi:hypothetical protein